MCRPPFACRAQVFSNLWQQFDLYGRRPPVPGYTLGPFYTTPVVATLDFGTVQGRPWSFLDVETLTCSSMNCSCCSSVVDRATADFRFDKFDANSTLDYGPMDKRAANGMIGEKLGEGHYGLIIIGDSNVRDSGLRMCVANQCGGRERQVVATLHRPDACVCVCLFV